MSKGDGRRSKTPERETIPTLGGSCAKRKDEGRQTGRYSLGLTEGERERNELTAWIFRLGEVELH